MGFNVKNVIIFGHIQFITDESLAIKEVRAIAMKYFDRVYADEKIKKSHDRCYAQRIGNNFQKRI